MRGALIFIGVVFIGMIAIALLITNGPSTENTPADIAKSPTGIDADTEDANSGNTAAIDGLPDRVVGEDLIAAPNIETEQLERLPARGPLSLPNLDTGEETDKPKLLFRPVALAAGVFEAQGHRVRIAGVEPTNPDTICDNEGSNPRPCGMQALTAFRYWLRGRALECDFGDLQVPNGETDTKIATCRIGKQDAGTWLVKYGWARAEAGGRYLNLEAAARQNKQGIFAVSN